MRTFALTYGVAFTCNRDSTDQAVMKNFRKLALRVHPDREREKREDTPSEQ